MGDRRGDSQRKEALGAIYEREWDNRQKDEAGSHRLSQSPSSLSYTFYVCVW